MAICIDNTISTLNKLGYNVVKYPRPSIMPLDLIIEQSGNYELVTSLPKYWNSGSKIPISRKEPVPNLNLLESSQLKGSIGAAAIFDIFKVKANVNGFKDKSIKLVVLNPQRIYCDFMDIANYIKQGDINVGDALYDYFFTDRTRVHIITEVIASCELNIIISGKSNYDAEITAKELSENISASLQGGSSSSKESEIVYKNDDQLITFGFRSSEISFKDDIWRIDLPKTSKKKFLGATEEIADRLLEENCRIKLNERTR